MLYRIKYVMFLLKCLLCISDSSDIVDGNLKLILALIWQLILRYQIGFSNIQNKNWLLAWLQAVIPKCKITNFTTDWNDGLALQ